MDTAKALKLIESPISDNTYCAVSFALGALNQYEYFWFKDYYYVTFNSACNLGIIFG